MAASFWSALTDRVSDVVSRRPGAVLIGSHLVSAAVFLYVLSEGRPVEYIKRKLFRVALSVASASGVVDAEMAKMKKSIEHSVIGSTLDGETLVTELPERGWSAEDVSATLRRYGERDSVVWKKGKVRACGGGRRWGWVIPGTIAAVVWWVFARRFLAPCTTGAPT